MVHKIKDHNKRKRVPTLLIILDGFGLTPETNPGNAITSKTAPNIFRYMKKYPSTTLTAHGSAVGLFSKQQGNSEAGHFTIGAGRIVKQDLIRISDAIEDGTFFKNEAFDQAVFHAKKYKRSVHVMGLLTNHQSAHAHPEHLYALLDYLRKNKQKHVYLHLFTDGRDSSPNSAMLYLKKLREHMKNGEEIATIIGRHYAMDRNKLWDRTEQTYNTMVLGQGTCTAKSPEEAITQAYARGETDEYICPTVITKKDKPVTTISDNDVIFFFNARSDRARQITKAFVQPNFSKLNTTSFRRKKIPKNTRFVAMTDFGPDLPNILTAFPSPDIPNCLAKAIGEEYEQLYISETEKYAHVTYFLNGGYASAINGEKRELVTSSGNYSYAEAPEMQAKQITKKIKTYLKNGTFNFITVNFANADMVGHTGDFDAAKKAVASVDSSVRELIDTIVQLKGYAVITADHGNAEEMIDRKTGGVMTQHTSNPVPCILVGIDKKNILRKNGTLADVAPTVLHMIGIKPPEQMKGTSLF